MVQDDGEGDESPDKESEELDANDEVAAQNESSPQIQEHENAPHDDEEGEEEHTQETAASDEAVELDEDEAAAIEETPAAIDNDESLKAVGPSGIDTVSYTHLTLPTKA